MLRRFASANAGPTAEADRLPASTPVWSDPVKEVVTSR